MTSTRSLRIAASLSLLCCPIGAKAQANAKPCSHGHTQAALNACAADDFKVAEGRLKIVYEQLAAALADSSRQRALKEAHDGWVVFREKQCRFEASAFEGGSMQPMQYYACLAAATSSRAKELRVLLAEERRP
jgi:uncharacterized protein YecT (DUF1311 family)